MLANKTTVCSSEWHFTKSLWPGLCGVSWRMPSPAKPPLANKAAQRPCFLSSTHTHHDHTARYWWGSWCTRGWTGCWGVVKLGPGYLFSSHEAKEGGASGSAGVIISLYRHAVNLDSKRSVVFSWLVVAVLAAYLESSHLQFFKHVLCIWHSPERLKKKCWKLSSETWKVLHSPEAYHTWLQEYWIDKEQPCRCYLTFAV